MKSPIVLDVTFCQLARPWDFQTALSRAIVLASSPVKFPVEFSRPQEALASSDQTRASRQLFYRVH